MDWEDLKVELNKARARHDKEQVISLIYTAVKRGIWIFKIRYWMGEENRAL